MSYVNYTSTIKKRKKKRSRKGCVLRSLTAVWATEATQSGGKSTGPELGDLGPKFLICTTKRLDNFLSQGPPSCKIP